MENTNTRRTMSDDLGTGEAVDILLDYLENTKKAAPNLQLPSPELRDYYNYEKDRIIWLQGDVNFGTLDIVKKIMFYNKQDLGHRTDTRKPIKIFIDTNGGNVSAMWTLINAIKISKTPVYTINFCEALSAGSAILAAGHRRFAMPGSTVLVHSGSCSYGGTVEQVENSKRYYDQLGKKADEQFLKDTKITAKMMKKKAPSDWFISDVEAVELGIVDEIVTDLDKII